MPHIEADHAFVVAVPAKPQHVCLAQAKRGALKDCPADDMLAAVLQATVDRTGVDPAVGYCAVECCLCQDI